MMIYTKKTYIRKLKNDLNESLDVTGYDIEQAFLDGYYDNKIETAKKKLLPIVVEVADENNVKTIESSKKESISILKIIAIGFGIITFLSFIFVAAVLYKSGLNLDKLLYPVLSFVIGSIFFTVFKDKYINN